LNTFSAKSLAAKTMLVHIRCLIPKGKQTANNKLLKVKLGLISSLMIQQHTQIII
jgi:hypothetical protein